MNEIIKFTNVSFQYDDDKTEAVKSVSFSVREGEFIAILGCNGSGKSTLAKLINALLKPTGGEAVVCGYDATLEENAPMIRRSAGMVFQNPDNQIVATIVEEDVAFGLENLGVPQPEMARRVDEALSAVGMINFKKMAPHMLSGGQKQRVAIAGVIAMRPRVVIFDESTAMLDPSGRDGVMEIALELKRQGITVILITHFMDEAAQAERVLVMEEGRIMLDGTPRDVFSQRKKVLSYGLDIPLSVELAALLNGRGLSVGTEILTTQELTERLCQISSK